MLSKLPSTILKEAFQGITTYPPSREYIEGVPKQVLLSAEDVCMWFEHLHTIQENCKRGAVRAAETRKQKRSLKTSRSSSITNEYYCGVCHSKYQEFTDVEEQWIGCKQCDCWYHFICLGITEAPDNFLCESCLVP